MDKKTREQAIGIVVDGMKEWNDLKDNRPKHWSHPAAHLPSVTIDQIAQRVIDDVIELCEDRDDFDDLSDEELAVIATDMVKKITKAVANKLKDEIVEVPDK